VCRLRQVLVELCDLLNEQKDILNRLLELAQEEQRILIGGESDKLEAVVRLELKELSKLNAAEKKRTTLNKTIATELGLTEGNISITEIGAKVEPAEKELLIKIQKELLVLIEEHAILNSQNRDLINSHMEYSNAMLDMLSEPEDPLNNFYGDDGKATIDKKKSSGFYSGHA
jgi:flagellar biosynthesis/type III secretory pathway chaperone